MKKNYVKPTTLVVEIQIESQLLNQSEIHGVSTNDGVDISYGGGSNQAARVKSNAVDWDDWGE